MENTLALVADHAQTDASGKLYMLGEFRYVWTATLPLFHPHFCVVGRWLADTVEVKKKANTVELEIVDQDGNPIAPRSPKMPLTFVPVGKAAHGKSHALLVGNLNGLMLQKYGDVAIHFIVNDSHCGSVTFHVADAPAKG